MLLMLTAAVVFSALPAAAVTVNTHEVKLNDTVTYDIHAIACPTKVKAVDISIFYDESSLEYIDGSLKTPGLTNAVTNTSVPGEILFNAVTLEGFDFTEDGVLCSAEFKVIDDSASEISLYYDVKNFIDEKKTELKDTYIYDITQITTTEAPTASAVIESKAEESSNSASDTTSSAAESEESEIIFDLAAPDEEAAAPTSSVSSDDIPSDKAIRFDTIDTPSRSTFSNNGRTVLLILLGVAIVFLIVQFFIILIRDRGGKGSHFSD